MPQNPIQFQKGLSLNDFIRQFGTEERCAEALVNWRWPHGFICPLGGHREPCLLPTRALYQCNHCHHQTSLTAATIFANTKLPLTTWFEAMYFRTQQKHGVSALELKRLLGVSYPTAWSLKHKRLQVMKERDDRRPLRGVVQLDDADWGGEWHGGTAGRGAPNKVPLLVAVATTDEHHPLTLRMSKVEGLRKREIARSTRHHIDPTAIVVSAGLACFNGVAAAGREHYAVVTGGGPASVTMEEFTWVNTERGNVKNAMLGSYHKASSQHLPRYLAEFCYRFNRRFALAAMLPRLARAALRTPPMPYRLLKLAEPHW
jgi:hypothetical protein